MNSLSSHQFSKSFGLFVVVGVLGVLTSPQALADAPKPPPSPPFVPPVMPTPTSEDALVLMRLDQTKKVCNQSISLEVENATLDDIVARLGKALATAKISSKILIEVRGAKPVRLSFSTKSATVSGVLSSAAMLADAQLWMFGDHLLIAPKEALTPAEQEALTKGFVTEAEAPSDRHTQIQAQMQTTRAYSTFISEELKELKPSPTANAKPPMRPGADGHSRGVLTSVAFEQLSPESKAMMQELLTMTQFPGNVFVPSANFLGLSDLSLSPSSNVALVVGEPKQVEVVIRDTKQTQWTMSWGLQTGSTTIIRQHPWTDGTKQPSRPQVTPFDPSAGGS